MIPPTKYITAMWEQEFCVPGRPTLQDAETNEAKACLLVYED